MLNEDLHTQTPRPPNPTVTAKDAQTYTSEADSGAHVTEHVARGDGGEVPEVGHRQAGGIAKPEYPQRQHEDGAHGQLGGAHTPR